MEEGKYFCKTLYLDREEQINDIINKVKACQEQKVALVLAENSKIFSQESNLKLLKYYLDKEGKEVVLVSPEPLVKQIANKLQIPVVVGLQELAVSLEQQSLMDSGKNYQVKRSRFPIYLVGSKSGVLLIGLLVIFLAAGGLIYVNLPWTIVEIIPATKNMEQEIDLVVSPGYQEIDLDNKLIPAIEKEEEIILSNEFISTGVKIIGKTKARGNIVVINEGKKAVFLPAGTPVSTLGGIGFVTAKDTSVPRREVELFMGVPVGLRAGKAETSIVALDPGTKGNVKSGEINQISGEFDHKIRVVNSYPTSGGENQEIKVVTAKDLKKAEDGIRERVTQEINNKVRKNIIEGEIILSNSLSIKKIEVGYNKKTEEEAERFTTTAKAEASILLVQKSLLQKASNYWLEKTVGEGYRLRDPQARIVSWQGQLIKPNYYNLKVKISGSARAKLEPTAISSAIAGLSIGEAEVKLTKMPEVGYFKIQSKDKSTGKLPKNNFLLKVKIREPFGNK